MIRTHAEASPTFVLGSYPDREAGRLALRGVRRAGFRRVAAVYRLPRGQVAVEGNDVRPSRAAILGAVVALATAAIYFGSLALTSDPPIHVSIPVAAAFAVLVAAAGALLGIVFSRWLDFGVRGSILSHYRNWVTAGETLVIVELNVSRARDALAILRGNEDARPQTFIIRPHRRVPERVAEFQRGERFSSERLPRYAARLADQHAGALRVRRPQPLWDRLRDCERTIDAITLDLAQAVQLEQSVSVSAEWLLDNAYVIQRQLADVRLNLSHQLYDALPTLETGARRGEPRAYDLAAELIAHTDAELIETDIVGFLDAYQQVSPLSMGELWALPLLLRLALAENLSYLATSIDEQQHEFEWADFWANRLLVAARRAPDQLLSMLAELSREHSSPSAVFANRLIDQLQGEALVLGPVLSWLELKWGSPVFETIAAEEHRSVTDQTTIANGIGSLRLLARLDWREIFEQTSLVEAILRAEPADVYRRMDFATRDRYRHAVEEIALRSRATEVETAQAAVVAAASVRTARSDRSDRANGGDYRGHVGYYLIDSGRAELESQVGYHPTIPQAVRLNLLRRPTLSYLGAIGIATAGVLAGTLALAVAAGPLALPLFVALGLLALLPASELAIQAVNFAVTRTLRPQPPPKLSFEGTGDADGVPDEWRTLAVVPTLLVSAASIREDLARLEIRYLANRDANLSFALLADLTDATARETAGDEALIAAAVEGIEALNRTYGRPSTEADSASETVEVSAGVDFVLFFRPRRWSKTERCWMGWERKRGKIEELNSWLLGVHTPAVNGRGMDAGDALRPIAGDASRLAGTRLVITLDADTQLPHGTARRLIGTLAHPLNRPRLSPDGRRVDGGYTIIQPRVSPSLTSATATRFSRVFADEIGVDPYTQAVSDLYQDLAGEGSYYGKGIYDVETFHRVLGNRFPEATLLSHDLLEGSYVRVGMATDVELFDSFPSDYLTEIRRQHRWIRGDWQIAAWGGPSVPDANGRREPNPVGVLSRWKITDNLRRSLVPATSVALLLFAWALAPGAATAATALVALGLLLLPTLGLLFWLPVQPLSVLTSPRAWRDQGVVWLRTVVNGAILPHHAFRNVDAIGRTIWRQRVTHRSLLQWQSYSSTSRKAGESDRGLVRQLSLIGLAALGGGVALLLTGSPAALVAAPFLLLWLGAPFVVVWLSGAYKHRPASALAGSDRGMLRRIARETWRYFDDFVGPETNWLPPDNYQEAPRAEIAERTSPTNVGLWLLATLAAQDLGYLTPEQVVARGEATLDTIDRLELFEGHLLNWYDTRTLDPLHPRYVSTVDSGNLLASLWTLVQGYRRTLARPQGAAAALAGLADTLALVLIHEQPTYDLPMGAGAGRLSAAVDALVRLFVATPEEPAEIARRLHAAVEPTRELVEALQVAARFDAPIGMSHPPEPNGGNAATATSSAYWSAQLERQLAAWIGYVDRDAATAQALDERLERLIRRVERLADGMNLGFLYDPKRRLFTIGYNVSDRRADSSYYDLLASEARVASLVAIAQSQVPVEHWFALGRPFGRAGGHRVLFSWSGTMFEYLMPLLLTRAYPHTLLDEAVREAVGLQIDYGDQQGVPWGISESAFAAVDMNQIYQYQAFGVPGLGLKRGLADDLVIAPYASALALLVDRKSALTNLRRLVKLGMRGEYGFYDAVDFTARRQPAAGRGAIVRNYMVHHEGMTLLALDNVLNAGAMPQRFHADRRIQAVESLLYERAPVAPVLVEATERSEAPARLPIAAPSEPSVAFDGPTPTTHLLGNGEYTVLLTSAGGGFSRWRDLDVTRFRADTTLDAHGTFVYLKDLDSGAVWSTTHQPTHKAASRQLTRFAPDRAEFERRDAGIGAATEIAVSAKHAAEIRRLILANYSGRRRRLEVTSYVELALAAHGADLAHPAFSRLFVETESLPGRNALIARRKPRSAGDPAIFAAHVLVLPNGASASADRPGSGAANAPIRIVGYETDRARFVGRGRGLDNPRALETDLSGSVGPVLDPIFSLRCAVTLEPGERVELAFVTGAAPDRAGIVDLVEKYENLHVVHRAIEAAVSQGQASARQLRVTAEDLRNFQQLAGPLIFPNARLRASEAQLRRNRRGQSGLWPQGISGDLPIALVTVGDRRDLDVVREALLAHAYWRILGFRADLVILNEEAGGYEQRLQGELRRTIQRYAPIAPLDQPGGIFLRPVELLSVEDQTLLFAVARAMLVAARGPLVQQLGIRADATVLPPPLAITRRATEEPSAPLPFLELPYFNGLGGFSTDGREYTTYLGPGTQTPAPWVNVLANPDFGAIVSESGTGFTWAANSQANRLTPWSNDPVSDPVGEAIYIRDEHLGVFWSPTAAPIREIDAYRARHGQGYTLFEHNSHAIEQELVTFVPLDDASGRGTPIRIQRLRLRNRSSRRRRLSVFAYADWVLGTSREETQAHVVTNWDAGSRTLLARNYYHPDFGGRIAFASASPAPTSFTADRTEFLGRNGSTARPAALLRQALSGRDGAGLDPAAALQVVVEIDPDEAVDVTFLLGEVADPADARGLIERFRDPVRVAEALQETRATWDRLLEAIQVETPDLAVNFQINRWLLYQTLSCRIWARSAFYQSGGAIGFRDQLQDCLALVYTAPEIARRQILTAAARQFIEGDVQHWWHPQSGAGVRTRMSDDLLWLPYAVARYVQTTGDASILDEAVPFIEGPVLADGQPEAYFVPAVSLEARSLLDHCRRAIARGDTRGAHGLPLIGTGDWNDGLSRVGEAGRGESVWLAWFLADVLKSFADLIEGRGLDGEIDAYRSRATEIAAAAEASAWDGEWYRRAYFDDGTPLGSAGSEAARIDSIPQSWAVISGLADPERAARAMRAVDEHLVRREADPAKDGSGIVLLFTPPFDDGTADPGYIKGYPPGVRENGGQYTHAAIWVAMAHARLGDGARAVEILRMLNPVEHARTPEAVERYRVEPYVVAADVYSLEGHVGQGGWTWYTGSAGWMYRVWVEEVLGLRVRGDELRVEPVIPPEWPGFTLRCRLRGASYEIRVENPDGVSRGVARVEVDGEHRPDGNIRLGGDAGGHVVVVRLGTAEA